MRIEDALVVLERWREAGRAVLMHIAFCAQCQEAHRQEAQHRPCHYCQDCDNLWAAEMICEANVIAILPDLPKEVRDQAIGFQFTTGNEA